MSALAIFIYGVFVSLFVTVALCLIVWGIVVERRDREAEDRERSEPGGSAS